MSSAECRPLRNLLLVCFCAAVAVDVLAGAPSWRALANGTLTDPDSYVRLIRIRDGLEHGGYGYMLPGDAGGAGTEIYWSHLLDFMILSCAAPLRLVLGPAAALYWGGVATGPISVGLLAAAGAWAVAPLAAPGRLWLAPLMIVLSTSVRAFGALGVVHYHIPMAILDVLAIGFAGRAAVGAGGRAAGLAGLFAALGIWLSPESLPFAAIAFGALVLAWTASAGERYVAVAPIQFGLAFLAAIAFALLIDPPLRGYRSVEFDRISIAYLVFALLVAGAGTVLQAVHGLGWQVRPRAATGLLAAGLAGAAWPALFPAVLSGTRALTPGMGPQGFFDGIAEMAPVSDTALLFLLLFAPLTATAFLAWSALHRRSLMRAYAALCGLALIVLGQRHVRLTLYPEVMAALALPVILTECTGLLADRPRLAALARAICLALFLLVPSGAVLLGPGLPQARAAGSGGCSLAGIAPLLAPYAGQVLLTSPSDVPELLYRTRVRTVGSLYHRGIRDFMRLRAAWRSRPTAGMPPEVLASGAAYILICPSPYRLALVADLPEDTLLDRLNRGDVPAWLVKLDGIEAGGYRLYRIAAPAS